MDRGRSTVLVTLANALERDAIDCAGLEWKISRSNPMIQWIAGNFVEGDNPNSNGQFWTAGDLELAEYSIRYSPLNMVHQWQRPIGFFADTRTVPLERHLAAVSDDDYSRQFSTEKRRQLAKSGAAMSDGSFPIATEQDLRNAIHALGRAKNPATAKAHIIRRARALHLVKLLPESWDVSSGDGQDVASQGSMKIQTLAGLWRHIFPKDAAQVDDANRAGLLAMSMECSGSHLRCAGPNGCGKEFVYRAVDTHCEHLRDRASIRHIVNPVFRGGAIIVPPARPGWSGATATVLDPEVMKEAAAFAEHTEKQYLEAAQAVDGELTTAHWETLMGLVLTADGGSARG